MARSRAPRPPAPDLVPGRDRRRVRGHGHGVDHDQLLLVGRLHPRDVNRVAPHDHGRDHGLDRPHGHDRLRGRPPLQGQERAREPLHVRGVVDARPEAPDQVRGEGVERGHAPLPEHHRPRLRGRERGEVRLQAHVHVRDQLHGHGPPPDLVPGRLHVRLRPRDHPPLRVEAPVRVDAHGGVHVEVRPPFAFV